MPVANSAGTGGPRAKRRVASVRRFLRKFATDRGAPQGRNPFGLAFARLGPGRRRDAVVLFGNWCRTDGCLMVVLAPAGHGWRLVSATQGVWGRVEVLPSRSKGWRDLAVAAGDPDVMHTALLRFDGRGYPSNTAAAPSVDRAKLHPLVTLAGSLSPSWELYPEKPLGPVTPRIAAVRRFLRKFVTAASHPGAPERDLGFYAGFARLGPGPREDAVVYLQGREWCGTGGCDTLVLEPVAGGGWKLLSQTAITWPPIEVLPSRSRGWQDLGVWVEGGGIQPGHAAMVPFTGRGYAFNPSVPPAAAVRHPHPLKVLIPARDLSLAPYRVFPPVRRRAH